ncbi:MAG: hypothetical protein ACREDU_03625 [Methylocella sp.]
MPIDWPKPPARRAVRVSFTFNGILESAAPFTPVDWSSPSKQRRLPVGFTIDGIRTEAQPFTPILQPDQPRKILRPSGYEQSVNLNLIGQDRFFGDPGQAPTYDWSSPPRKRALPVGFVASGIMEAQATPITPIAWPDPPRPRARQVGFVVSGILTETPPPAPVPWPNAAQRRGATAGYVSGNLLLTTLAQPFSGFIWEGPQRRITKPQVWPVGMPLTLLTAEQPFVQTDWRSPRRPAQSAQSWSVNLLQTTLAAAAQPFTPIEWRNPPRLARMNISFSWDGRIVLGAPVAPTAPFGGGAGTGFAWERLRWIPLVVHAYCAIGRIEEAEPLAEPPAEEPIIWEVPEASAVLLPIVILEDMQPLFERKLKKAGRAIEIARSHDQMLIKRYLTTLGLSP